MLRYQVVKVGVLPYQVVEGGVLRYQRSTGVLGHAQLLRVVCSDTFFSRKCHRKCLKLIVHELLRLVCSDIKLLKPHEKPRPLIKNAWRSLHGLSRVFRS